VQHEFTMHTHALTLLLTGAMFSVPGSARASGEPVSKGTIDLHEIFRAVDRVAADRSVIGLWRLSPH
jgi:hypothetical protein